MGDPKHPVPGDLIIDASDLACVDIVPEEIPKLIKFRDGVAKAIANVMRLKPEEVERAGINPNDFQRLLQLIADYHRADELYPAAAKLTELLYETKLDRAHQISVLFGEIGAQARRRAAHDPKGAAILGPLQDLLNYQYGPARQGAATRAKKANGEAPPPAPPTDEPAPTP